MAAAVDAVECGHERTLKPDPTRCRKYVHPMPDPAVSGDVVASANPQRGTIKPETGTGTR